jgi:hypothetical protein
MAPSTLGYYRHQHQLHLRVGKLLGRTQTQTARMCPALWLLPEMHQPLLQLSQLQLQMEIRQPKVCHWPP